MDENSLVSNDPDLWLLQRAAARVEPMLKRVGVIQGNALIARDEIRHSWSILLPRSRDTSQMSIFREINRLLVDEKLEAPLDAFTVVDYEDPGFKELSNSAITPPARYKDFGVIVEISGRVFSDPLRIPVDPVEFEQYVIEAMTTVFPDRTGVEAMAPFRTTSAQFPRDLATLVDFSLEYRGKFLMVEIKATRRPLSTRHVLAAYGALAITREKTGWHPFLMVVSMNGFTQDAYDLFDDSADFALVDWSYGDDPQILRAAFDRHSH